MKPYAYQICGQPEGKYACANESIQKGIILLENVHYALLISDIIQEIPVSH